MEDIMKNQVAINGRVFTKSSFSTVLPRAKCVGVSISSEDVLVTNLNQKDSPIIRFTRDEWVAFVMGVKNGEFDLR